MTDQTTIPSASTSFLLVHPVSIKILSSFGVSSLPSLRVWIAGRQKRPVTGHFFPWMRTLFEGAI
jgi:hypothetical protein